MQERAFNYLKLDFNTGIVGVLILQYLKQYPGVSRGNIAHDINKRLNVSKSKVFVRVRHLLILGLVEAPNGRTGRMDITPLGLEALKEIKSYIKTI